MMLFFLPVGFYYTLVHKVTHGKLFIGMYGVFITYFAGCMVRLMILMAPCMCLMAGIAVSYIFRRSTKAIRHAMIGKVEDDDQDDQSLSSKDTSAIGGDSSVLLDEKVETNLG